MCTCVQNENRLKALSLVDLWLYHSRTISEEIAGTNILLFINHTRSHLFDVYNFARQFLFKNISYSLDCNKNTGINELNPPAATPHGERTAQSNQLASDVQLPGLSCRSNLLWKVTKFVEEPRDRELYISAKKKDQCEYKACKKTRKTIGK